jgi:threonine/homoserine/homoserine lactone efflux protein
MDPFLTGYFFLKGIAIGLLAAAPIGPVNILVIQQTLRHGRLSGLLTGIGAMMGDGVFAIITAFGISAVATFVLTNALYIQLVGALILIAMGLKTYRTRPRVDYADNKPTIWTRTIASTFALTVTNPMTMLGFAALFAGVGGVGEGDFVSAGSIVAGVLVGSGLWWLVVSQGIGLIRRRIDDDILALINRISGTLIVFFGLAMLARLGVANF